MDFSKLIMTCLGSRRLISIHFRIFTMSKVRFPFSVNATSSSHGLRTPNEAPFHWNPKLLGLGRQIKQNNFRAFGVFSVELSIPILVFWVTCPYFPLFSHYFYKKTKPLFPHPKYLIGIGIWIGQQKIRDLVFVCP